MAVRTQSEWFELIKADLASNKAFVPLDEADLRVALSNALDIWNQYLPIHDHRSLKIPNGLLILDLSGEAGVCGVGEFHYTDSTVDINRTLTPFYPIQILSMSLQGPRFMFEVNHTIERWAQLLGGKEDQIWDPERKQLFIWNPRGQTNITFVVMKDVDITKVESHRYAIFRKLFLVKAREQLIQIFERLGPLPGPEGEIKSDMEFQKAACTKDLEEVIQVLERMPEAMVSPRWD